jgi:hypothetical protein
MVVLSRWYDHFVYDHYRLHGSGATADPVLTHIEPIWCDFTEPAELLGKIRGRQVWWIVDTRGGDVPDIARRVPPEHRLVTSRSYDGLELWRLEPSLAR